MVTTTWEIRHVEYASPKIARVLAEGWEPFAVTDYQGEATIWLRRAKGKEPQA